MLFWEIIMMPLPHWRHKFTVRKNNFRTPGITMWNNKTASDPCCWVTFRRFFSSCYVSLTDQLRSYVLYVLDLCVCVCTRLSSAPCLETLQVSCGNGRYSSSGESGTSSPCVSSFGKADFGKPNRSPRCWGELMWRRRKGEKMKAGGKQTCVCGTFVRYA